MHTTARPVLLAYDGSTEAKHAIATAGELLGGHAVVVHAYATPTADAEVIAGPGVALAVDPVITAEAEQRAREQARAIVDEGVAVAGAAGFDAQPELVPGDGVHAVWNAIVALAERYDASVIVVGHGDLSWLEEKVLGRVDTGVVKHAGRPVLVVPAPPE
jgi:nucleotide-binding universal stress UspA family protein